MSEQVQLGDMTIEVVRKDIKNVHLSVHPPTGKVRIAAPSRMNLETLRVFAIAKLSWIHDQQRKLQEQARETPREYLDRESHYVWGQRTLLTLVEAEQPPSVEVSHSRLILTMRPGSEPSKREAILEDWYREQLRAAIPSLIKKWEHLLGVKVGRLYPALSVFPA